MKKISAVCVFLFAFLIRSDAQSLPNGGMENWTLGTGYEDPNGWVELNVLSIACACPISVTKLSGPAAHSGSFAAQIETVVLPASSPVHGLIPSDTVGTMFTGTLVSLTAPPLIGFRYYGRPDSINFYYEYFPMPSVTPLDTGACIMRLSKYHPATHTTTTVATGLVTMNTLCSNWVRAAGAFHYLNAEIPDTATITFVSSYADVAIPGSILMLDDVAYGNSPPTVSQVETDTLYWDAALTPAPIDITGSVIPWNDSTNLASATVQISTNLASAEDVLEYTTLSGITGSYSSSTGVLQLTGITSYANYQIALRSIKYKNTSATPVVSIREIKFSVSDGVTSSNNESRYVDVLNTTGLANESNGTNRLLVFPNPAKDKIQISVSEAVEDGARLEIFSVAGKKMSSTRFEKNVTEVDVHDFAAGVYFAKLSDTSGQTLLNKKFNVTK